MFLKENKLKQYTEIYGAFGEKDCNFYKKIAEMFPDGSIFVEIGSFEGRSAICMANHLIQSKKTQSKIICIDPFTGNPEQGDDILKTPGLLEKSFLINTDEYRKLGVIEVIKGFSLEVAKQFKENSIDFVFIDGLHDYTNVYADIETWYSKVKSSGIVSGHDVHNPYFGVKQAVDEFTTKHKKLCSIDEAIFWFVK